MMTVIPPHSLPDDLLRDSEATLRQIRELLAGLGLPQVGPAHGRELSSAVRSVYHATEILRSVLDHPVATPLPMARIVSLSSAVMEAESALRRITLADEGEEEGEESA